MPEPLTSPQGRSAAEESSEPSLIQRLSSFFSPRWLADEAGWRSTVAEVDVENSEEHSEIEHAATRAEAICTPGPLVCLHARPLPSTAHYGPHGEEPAVYLGARGGGGTAARCHIGGGHGLRHRRRADDATERGEGSWPNYSRLASAAITAHCRTARSWRRR